MPRNRLVVFGKISRPLEQRSLFDRDFQLDIIDAISPTRTFEFRNRKWHFSRPTVAGKRHLFGKLGFERIGEREAITFDDESQDFVSELRIQEQANYSHFVIDLDSEVVAFEERRPDLTQPAFIRAFGELTAANGHPFVLEPLPDLEDFREWLESVDRVVQFRAQLRRPNPGWRRRTDEIRSIIERTNADQIVISAQVSTNSSESLKVDDTILEESAEHASRGYGHFTVVAEAEGQSREFRSVRRTKTRRVETRPDDTSDSIFARIRQLLASGTR